MADTPPTPFQARPAASPPAGLDFNTSVAMRLDSVESDVRKVIRQQTKTDDAVSKHAARLSKGDAIFDQILKNTAEIKGAILWTIKLIVGAVLLALLGTVVWKDASPAATRSAPASASSSSSSP